MTNRIHLVILVIVLLITRSSFSQVDTAAFWKFNASKFGVPDPDHAGERYLKDSTKIQLIASKDSYQVGITRLHSDTTTYYTYYKSTRTLKRYAQEYKRMSFGISRTYNEKGNLIEERNYDAAYKLSIAEVEKRLRDEFHFDLKDPKHPTGISRSTNPTAYYHVFYYLEYGFAGVIRTIMMDADTGKILMDETHPYESCKAR